MTERHNKTVEEKLNTLNIECETVEIKQELSEI